MALGGPQRGLPDGRTLISTHEDRPNNWGTNAGAGRIAAALYLQDSVDLQAAADVFKGWLGDRSAYAGFIFGGSTEDLSWQADPLAPVGINPLGSTKFGANTDGVLPDEMRRHSGSPWDDPNDYPRFPRVNYAYEGLQGASAQAVMLHRAGYDVWNWEDQALLRAFQWMHTPAPDGPGFAPDPLGDDGWMSYLMNYYYGASFPLNVTPLPGKNVGWADWSHACSDLVTDADADLIPDSCDNCLGISNPEQDDADLDGVGDACDNCTRVANPAITPLAFQTTTGGQLDDDADGFGNMCDGDMNGIDLVVNPADLSQFKASYGKKRTKTNCGSAATSPCDVYDMDGDGFLISAPDLGRFKAVFGAKQGKGLWVRCSTCPLACAGDACGP